MKIEVFELTEKVYSEIESKNGKLKEMEQRKNAIASEIAQLEEEYKSKVLEGVESKELDKILDNKADLETKLKRREQELELVQDIQQSFSVDYDEFADKWNAEYYPKMHSKHVEPILDKLKSIKEQYISELENLEAVLSALETEHIKAEKVQNLKGFKTANVIRSLKGFGIDSNEVIQLLITEDDFDFKKFF